MKSKIGGLFKTVACAAAVSCAAFSFTSAAEAETLRVGTEATYAPFEFAADDGSLTGFDVELIRAIGKEAGYDDVQVINMPFDGLIPAIMTSQIDVIIAAMTITPERAERVDFSDPYYRCGLTFLTLKQNADKFSTFDDIAKAKICVQIGTTGALFLQKTLKNPDMRQFNTPPETYLELQNGGCEVVVNDRPVNDFFLAQSPENKANVVSKDIDIAQNEYYGIAIAKGNTELLKQVNEGLQRVIDNGKFAEISNKWFGYDITDDLKAHSAEAAAALAGGGSGK